MQSRWEYLLTPAYRVRHAIAAHLVADCPEVVDVGAYRAPLPVSQPLHSIDPLATIDGAHHCTVSEFWQQHGDMAGFGLVVLGLDLIGDMKELHAIREMMDAASVVVIEWSVTQRMAEQQALWLLLGHTPTIDMTLSLPNVATDGYPCQGERRLVCWTT